MTPGCQEKCQDLDNNGSKGEGRNTKPKKGRFSVQEEGDVFIKQAVLWHFEDKKKKGYANMTGSKKSTRLRKSKGWGENQETGKSQNSEKTEIKASSCPHQEKTYILPGETKHYRIGFKPQGLMLRKVSKNSSSCLLNECSLSIANFTYFADQNVLKDSHIRYQWLPSIV